MMLEEAMAEDAPAIRELILKEFPYAKVTERKISDKIGNPFFMILKGVGKGGEMLGFAEFQVMDAEAGIARLNGITIREGARGKGYARELMDGAIKKIRENGYKKIILLVKVENKTAKELYRGLDFKKTGTLGRLIDNSRVEEWELGL